MFAVYWTHANFPVKSRFVLHCTQLALLCNSNDVRLFGYKKVLSPLLNDLKILEVDVYIESLGENLKGTFYSIVADNLAAHGLAGFNESFRSTHFCRFCHATRMEMQTENALTGDYVMRTKDFHDYLHQLQSNGSEENYGVKNSCVFLTISPISILSQASHLTSCMTCLKVSFQWRWHIA